jgi:hypothetical protein
VAGVTDTHVREYGLRYPQGAKEVGVELSARLFLADLFNATGQTVACVIHDHVEGTHLRESSFDGGVHRRSIVHVHSQHERPISVRFEREGEVVGPASRRDDAVAVRERTIDEGATETTARSGNEPRHRRHFSLLR